MFSISLNLGFRDCLYIFKGKKKLNLIIIFIFVFILLYRCTKFIIYRYKIFLLLKIYRRKVHRRLILLLELNFYFI
jgi:hypothetical protein